VADRLWQVLLLGTFYGYAPILMVATGEGKLSGGLVVSLGNALLAFAVGWGRLGTRFGVRTIVGCPLFHAPCSEFQPASPGSAVHGSPRSFSSLGINFAVALDAVAAAPFFRAAHPLRAPADDCRVPHQSGSVGPPAAAHLQRYPSALPGLEPCSPPSACSAPIAPMSLGGICHAPCRLQHKKAAA
jgi:hypothetical protein